MNRLQAVPR